MWWVSIVFLGFMKEGDFIEKYLVKLTNGNGFACGLQDDVARLSLVKNVVVNTDTTIQGVHILKTVPVNFVAYKAMVRAFSDIFAKTNGEVVGYFLNIVFPKDFKDFGLFMRGFEDFAERYKCDLLGGDISVYGKDLVVVVTVVAELVGGHLKRCDAKVGDGVFLTKKVGEAFLDFERTKRGNWEENEYLMPSLVRIGDFSKINALMDVSDGLVKDAGRMGVASKVLLEIDYKLLPSSVEITREMLEFGDDYNVLMTAERGFVENAVKVGVVRESLGRCGVVLKNLPFEIRTEGFDHFE